MRSLLLILVLGPGASVALAEPAELTDVKMDEITAGAQINQQNDVGDNSAQIDQRSNGRNDSVQINQKNRSGDNVAIVSGGTILTRGGSGDNVAVVINAPELNLALELNLP